MKLKEEIKTKEEELGEKFKFNLHIPQTQTTTIVEEIKIEIKHETVDYNNHTSTSHAVGHSELKTMSSIQRVSSSSIQLKTEDKDLTYFHLNLDLIKCEEDSETHQPIHDPLHIDPLHNDHDPRHTHQSPSLQVKWEVDEDNEEMDCSEVKSNSKPDTVQIEKSFKCDVCEKSFRRNAELAIHKAIQSGETDYKCKECGNGFISLCRLTLHRRIHTGENPYNCVVCEKSFISSKNLLVHKRIHSGEKPFKCDECQMSFKQSNHLSDHKRTHTGERPFTCDVCNKGFGRNRDLTRHKRIHTMGTL